MKQFLMGARIASRGVTLPEILVGIGVFSLLSLALFMMMSAGLRSFLNVDSRFDAHQQLTRAQSALLSDVQGASLQNLAADPGQPALVGGTPVGGALWFYSAIDPATGEFMRDDSGLPQWQTVNLYYLTTPTAAYHLGRAGQTCTLGVNGHPYEDQCPHKILIRKVIAAPATFPTYAAMQAYMTQPADPTLSTMAGEPGLLSAKIVAHDLLWFGPQKTPNSLSLSMKAVRVREARREIGLGNKPLASTPFSLQLDTELIPGNP